MADLFEDNPVALAQIRWHQEYLAAFRSRGSSANNHVVAEAVGRLVAACAFPWFEESDGWRRDAARELHDELAANTFPSGVNREQASDYHRFVTELGLVALVETQVSGHPLPGAIWDLLVCSFDAAAAMLDASGSPPRQGDGDEGRALVLEGPDTDPWAVLLGCGAATVGACDWWQPTEASVAAAVLGSLATDVPVRARPSALPPSFDDAGLHILRASAAGGESELWCRCDGGPQGFLSIAAHGHADALSLEVRVGGVELLVDPGTYCYHGEREWRSYFRSTRAHNTVEVDSQSQAVEAGPFMWATHADGVDDGLHLSDGVQRWSAHHRGYARLDPELVHARTVLLDGPEGTLTVMDTLTGSALHTASLAWHLGPEIDVALLEDRAVLTWPGPRGEATAVVRLPAELSWTAHRGESAPVLGWYSPRFGVKVPTTTLVGNGSWTGVTTLTTVLDLRPARDDADPTPSGGAVASLHEAC